MGPCLEGIRPSSMASVAGATPGTGMLGAMGLIHMNGRVQDAITGRFLSADPNIPNPGYTQSYNRYAYVNNNPLSFIDPSGFRNVNLMSSAIGVTLLSLLAAVLRGRC